MKHDKDSFTQGLVYNTHPHSTLYESAGLYKQSDLRKIDPSNGEVLIKKALPDEYFAEGITTTPKGDILMLTWREKTGFVFDGKTLDEKKRFQYETHTGEGWGITSIDHDPSIVIASDGSSFLFVWDSETFAEKRRIPVTLSSGAAVRHLNELEYYQGDILANIWYNNRIVRIDIETGVVKMVYDFTTLWPQEERLGHGADCFNGIAVLPNDELLVTGKLWPSAYKITLDR
jgi:glutamine cyclotransferase